MIGQLILRSSMFRNRSTIQAMGALDNIKATPSRLKKYYTHTGDDEVKAGNGSLANASEAAKVRSHALESSASLVSANGDGGAKKHRVKGFLNKFRSRHNLAADSRETVDSPEPVSDVSLPPPSPSPATKRSDSSQDSVSTLEADSPGPASHAASSSSSSRSSGSPQSTHQAL